MFEAILKEFLRLLELSCLTIDLRYLISGGGVGGIDHELVLKSLQDFIEGISFLWTHQERAADSKMDTGPFRVQGQNLSVLSESQVIMALGFVRFASGLMVPNRTWRHLRHFP